jgi:hypothetical protein
MLQGSTFSLECAAFPRIFYPAIDIPHAGCNFILLWLLVKTMPYVAPMIQ